VRRCVCEKVGIQVQQRQDSSQYSRQWLVFKTVVSIQDSSQYSRQWLVFKILGSVCIGLGSIAALGASPHLV
jgi:hypothetical protein